jgi:hypothetical protein
LLGGGGKIAYATGKRRTSKTGWLLRTLARTPGSFLAGRACDANGFVRIGSAPFPGETVS